MADKSWYGSPMRVARVQMPDGRIARVEVPADTPPEQIAAFAQRHAAQAPKPAAPAAPKPTSYWQGVLEEVGKAAGNTAGFIEKMPLVGDSFRAAGAALAPFTGDASLASNARNLFNAKMGQTGYRGSTAGKITGGVLAALPTAAAPGGILAQGALAGGLMTDDPNGVGLARDAAIGAAGNKIGEQVGKRVLAPALERVGRTAPVRAAAEALAGQVNRLRPNLARLPQKAPVISQGEQMVSKAAPDIAGIRQNIQEAADMGLPYALADAAPELRNLGGSVARYSPSGRALAERNFVPRSLDQATRAVDGIDSYLAPITDIKKRGAEIIEGGKPVYGPLYEQAYAAPPITSPTIEGVLSRQMVKPAIGRASLIADAEFRNPRGMGFGVDDLGEPVLNPVPVQAMDRLDAGRQGWDAANSAYEVAMRRQQASLHPQQFSREVADAERALVAANAELDAAKSGFVAAPKSSDVQGQMAYTTHSLDYIKRGIDDVLEPQRNQITGKLDLDEGGRALNNLQRTLLGEVDKLNPIYGEARQAYGKFAQQKDALETGFGVLPSGKLPTREFDAITSRMAPENLPEAQRGYATAMADAVDRQRLSANPYEAIYGSPQNQAKVGALFPEGSGKFQRLYNLEKDMAATKAETLGGSQTQGRRVADELFENDLVSAAADAGIQAASGGGLPGGTKLLGMAARAIKDRSKLGLLGAKKKADALAPALFDTENPQNALGYLDDLIRKQAEQRARRQAYERTAGLLAAPAGLGVVAGSR